jgi:RNA polymerase-binding transcription factor DksA
MNDTTKYKKALEIDLAQIVENLEELGVHNPQVGEDWIATPGGDIETEADANIAADRAEDWAERRATMAPLETRFNNINRALQKIEKGTFGLCEICKEQIEEDRLDFHPSARTCKAHINDEEELPA